MKYALLIACREYAENAKTKGFWLGLFLFPAIWILAIQVPLLFEKKGTPTRNFLLVDASGEFVEVIRERVTSLELHRQEDALRNFARTARYQEPFSYFINPETRRLDLAGWREAQGTNWLNVPGFTAPRPRYREVSVPDGLDLTGPAPEVAERLRPWLRGERKIPVGGEPEPLFAAVIVPANILTHIRRPDDSGATNADDAEAGIQYWSANQADESLRSELERAVNNEVRRREFLRRGLDAAAFREVEQTAVPFTSLNPQKEKGEEKVGMADRIRQWLPSAFVYLLWVAIFAISQMLLNSVIEEKSNRIIEVLLSSVTPGELMMGKLIGIAGIGLTMLGAWILSFVAILWWKAGGLSPEAVAAAGGGGGGLAQLPNDLATILKTTWLLPAFALYFLLGYLLYAGFFLALGSTCNTIKDAQNYMGVIVLFLMVPLFAMTFIPRDPNGPIATVLSWIPPYTPFVMMNRITADPPWRDVIGTTLLLLAFTALVLWGCGKIFRLAILRTGQPPKLLELLRWLRGK